MAACPTCQRPIADDVPRIGELIYPCECGYEIDGNELRVLSGMADPPEPAPKPKRASKKR